MLDLTMPVKDGFVVARATSELRIAVPLVFLTGLVKFDLSDHGAVPSLCVRRLS
jgi:hypothetical protein